MASLHLECSPPLAATRENLRATTRPSAAKNSKINKLVRTVLLKKKKEADCAELPHKC